MADPMAELEELDTINTERVAAGLAETSSIAEAREWKAQQGQKAEGAEQVKAGEPKPIDETQTQAEPVKFTAPVAKRAEPKADDGELAAAKAEIQRLKSEAGRSTVLANELRDLKAERDAAERRAQEAEQKAEEALQKASGGGMFSFLTDEQRETMTPEAIAAIERGVTQYVNKAMAAVEAKTGSGVAEMRATLEQRQAVEAQRAERERQSRAEATWKRVAQTIPSEVYGRLDNHPKWDEWCLQRYSGITNADLYENAIADGDDTALVEHLRRALKYANIEIPTKGSKPPLRVDATAGGGATPTTTEPEENRRFSYEEINAINQRFVRGQSLPTGWSMKDFTAWSERMEKAQAEGRVVDAQGNPVYDQPL